MDISLLITCIAISVLIVISIVIAMVVYSHPDDSNQARLPRVVIFVGLFMAAWTVFLTPLDVMNTEVDGGLDMSLLWAISIFSITAILVIGIPFAFWYYEAEGVAKPGSNSCCFGLLSCPGLDGAGRLIGAITFTLVLMIVFGIALGVMYAFMSDAEIAVVRHTVQWGDYAKDGKWDTVSQDAAYLVCPGTQCTSTLHSFNVKLSFFVFTIAVVSFLGWWFFTIFLAVGLPALPIDMINTYRTRPKPMLQQEYSKGKEELGKRACLLEEVAENLRQEALEAVGKKPSRSAAKKQTKQYRKVEISVYKLKADYLHLETAFVLKGGNPLWYWGCLIGGVIGGSISFMWFLHIVLFMLPQDPIHPLLNNLITGLEVDGFWLFSSLAFAFYAGWLLICTIKGSFRLGLRIPLIMRIYPMEFGNTLVNAFLVNTWIICVCSFTCVQFCALAFPVYTSGTTVLGIFGVQIKFLPFFKYFFMNNVFLWTLTILVVITAAWLVACPHDTNSSIERELMEQRKSRAGGQNIKLRLPGV